MAFARMKKFTPAEAKKYIQTFKEWLERNAEYVKAGEEEDEWDYMFTLDAEKWESLSKNVYNIYPNMYVPPEIQKMAGIQRARAFMISAHYLEFVYMDYPNNTKIALYWRETGDSSVSVPTMMKGMVRMPKLSHLITLTPEDFFTIVKLIYNAKSEHGNDRFKLDLTCVGLDLELLEMNGGAQLQLINRFFRKLKVNYMINPQIAMQQWMQKSDLETIIDLEPTTENQLYAIQYITASSQNDVYFFPTDSAIELELDWEQTNDDKYVIRPQQ